MKRLQYLQVECYFNSNRAVNDLAFVSWRKVQGLKQGRILRIGNLRFAIRWLRLPIF